MTRRTWLITGVNSSFGLAGSTRPADRAPALPPLSQKRVWQFDLVLGPCAHPPDRSVWP
jgi:hypothetical protein